MQQEGGGGGTQYGKMTPSATATVTATTPTHMAPQQPVESASPISSRPPATSVTSNLDEFMRLSGCGDEDESDRAGGAASGNRWPRQETLALLKIRSDMDAAFLDATVKGPLWDDVSRKLSELGYKRSAKKCKEKFENVHKYYKRTKEGRAGRQDGKSYKFFSQLEALHSSTRNVSVPVTTVTLDVAPVSVGSPLPISSGRIPTSHSHSSLGISAFPIHVSVTTPTTANIPGSTAAKTPPAATTKTTKKTIGISFSSDSDSSSHEMEDDGDDEEEMDFEGQPSNTVGSGSSRKRKRQSFSSSSSSSNTLRMMEFFESLMKHVMQKQETMQQSFLEVIEKREQDRMIREEAWKRQEMARLTREHEVMTQEQAISASRDAAIISFLQKITGQTIQLPPAVTIPAPPSRTAPVVVVPAVPLPTPTQHHVTPSSLPQERRDQQNQQLTEPHHRHQQQQGKIDEMIMHQPPSTSIPYQVVIAIPEQQIPPSQEISGGSLESSSSRWPKVEVLALIKLRSGLEHKYREAGPKGPLWGEISAGMQRFGYNRSAKRCKEKWENINKYFKKVKESNKKRPKDAKTCPYFHELDALYRKKILGSGSTSCGGGGGTSTNSFNISEEQQPQQHQQERLRLHPTPAATNPQESSNVSTIMLVPQLTPALSENKSIGSVDEQASNVGLPGSLFGEGNGRASNKPEDIVKELMNQQWMRQQQQPVQQSIGNDFDKMEESNTGSDSDNVDHEEDYDEDEDDHQDELEEERKMAYKVEFQRQNRNASNGGGNGEASFLAVVQ